MALKVHHRVDNDDLRCPDLQLWQLLGPPKEAIDCSLQASSVFLEKVLASRYIYSFDYLSVIAPCFEACEKRVISPLPSGNAGDIPSDLCEPLPLAEHLRQSSHHTEQG
ncbi:hypothetical protein SRHO_G00045630 [Serrasalmus rhombeus]